MKQIFQAILGRNWKTTGMGLSAICSGIGDIAHSVSVHAPINFNIDIPAILGGFGLIFAKDSDNHSTVAEVQAASTEAKK